MKAKPAVTWKDIKEETLKSNIDNPVILTLIKHLKDRKESLEAQDRTETVYDNANWANLQAHRNGRAQEIYHILQLLSFAETKR